MPDTHADAAGSEASRDDPHAPGTGTVEAYETDGSVVLYDAERPLAWVEASSAVRLTDAR